MEELVENLMATISHKALSRRITPGVDVETPRGYGVVASVVNSQYFGGGNSIPAEIVVELDGGQRAMFLPRDLKVVA